MNNTNESADCNITNQTPIVSEIEPHKRYIGTWRGMRPFLGAVDYYIQLMRHKLDGCIKYINSHPMCEFAQVKVAPNQELEVCLDDGTTATYKFNSVHYGPFKHKEAVHWKSRYNIYENLQIYPPFRTLQIEMLNRGYFLVDESDPDRSKRMVIKLYKTKPKYPLYLWHGYGVIPNLGNVIPQVNGVIPNLGNVIPPVNEFPALGENQSATGGDDGEAEEKGDN